MPARKKTTRKSSLKVRAKRDPIGTVKSEVKKTGALQYPIGAYVLGLMGGTGVAIALAKVPIVGAILSPFAKKGASLASKFTK